MKNILVAIVLFALLFSGCKTQKELVYLPAQTVKDTVSVEKQVKVIVRDTLIKTERVTVGASIPKSDLTDGFRSEFNNKNAQGSIEQKNGRVLVDCTCDSLEVKIQLREKEINTLEKRLKETNTSRPVQYTPWFIKALAWVGGIALALLVLTLALKKFKVLK